MSKNVKDQFQAPNLDTQTIEELKNKDTSITINRYTHILLRHIKSRMGITQNITWDQFLQLLVVMFNKGQGFGKIRDSQEIKEILGE